MDWRWRFPLKKETSGGSKRNGSMPLHTRNLQLRETGQKMLFLVQQANRSFTRVQSMERFRSFGQTLGKPARYRFRTAIPIFPFWMFHLMGEKYCTDRSVKPPT